MTEYVEKAVLSHAAVELRPAAKSHAWPSLAEARALAVLAGPLIITQLAQMAVFTTDVILLGRFSRMALAAAAIGNTVYYFAWITGGGPAFAVAPIIAQIRGLTPGNRGGVRGATRMGLWAILIISAPMIVLLWQTKAILIALGQDRALADSAGAFVRMVSLGLPFTLAFRALGSFTTAVAASLVACAASFNACSVAAEVSLAAWFCCLL